MPRDALKNDSKLGKMQDPPAGTREKITSPGEIDDKGVFCFSFQNTIYLPRGQIKFLMLPGRKGDLRGADITPGANLRRLRYVAGPMHPSR